MADAMETIKNLLGDENQLKSMVSSLTSGNQDSNGLNLGGGDLDYIMQMKDIMEKIGSSRNDPRSNLLMSLKPYMRSNRQTSIDNAVKMLNMVKVISMFK